MSVSSAKRRLDEIVRAFDRRASLGTLRLGTLTYDVTEATSNAHLPRLKDLLDHEDSFNLSNLHFILQKYLLGQDVFLLSQPGPYARRLAMTFCSLINSEYEYIALHRDIGETELKQGRELREGNTLAYIDSAAVRAVKHGRVLIIEGIEKAERGILPTLNNLLENREMNLDDGTHILHPSRHALLPSTAGDMFIPAHRSFRVIAIGAPVPPYTGYPLDPPFRSRFQARFVDALGSLLVLSKSIPPPSPAPTLLTKLTELILRVQYASEIKTGMEALTQSSLPPFPQTSLKKLHELIGSFPPPSSSSLPSSQLSRLVLTIHPGLLHAKLDAWVSLSQQVADAGLGSLEDSYESAGLADGSGLLGYKLAAIERAGPFTARVRFIGLAGSPPVSLEVAAGPLPFRTFPLTPTGSTLLSNRFMGLLTSFVQVHALGWDISFVPPVLASTASCSTSLLMKTFAEMFGYELETVHLYKELGGREIFMRRHIESNGATSWEPSPLVKGAFAGRIVHMNGIDIIGSTAGALARMVQDREVELWEGKRVVVEASEDEIKSGDLLKFHPSFRLITSASKSLPLRDWLSDEHSNMFLAIPSQPMDEDEESAILQRMGCPLAHVQTLLAFAEKYRRTMSSDSVQKNRKLGTRSLGRIAKRLAKFPWDDDLHKIISRAVLAEFLPATERMTLDVLFEECGIKQRPTLFNLSPKVEESGLVFVSEASDALATAQSVFIPKFDAAQDPEGVKAHVPHMDNFYDNSLQTGLMKDMATDLEMLGEHLVLLGNQGVGKNKIVDRYSQLLGRPREYIQLHRDTTVNQLMFHTSLEAGQIKYTDSPLLRAIMLGRLMVVDEADKAPEHVVAVFKSLGAHGEMSLSDGRRVRPVKEREDDIVVHPNFRMVLLANRPGYPFLGNHFLQVLGDNFSCHSVGNPDMASERDLLGQMAPEMDPNLLRRLVAAFQDLRKGYEEGTLSYPYSLRELINLVRHMKQYPEDSLDSSLRNIFDFDVASPDTIDILADILQHHGLKVEHLGLDAVRSREALDVAFEPKGPTDLDEPKFGKEDPEGGEHTGGNTFAGGTGGRDTAGMGGRGGYMRLYKAGQKINQVSDELKAEVPEEIREQAREMARQELARRLEELNMSSREGSEYSELLTAVQSHIARLYDLLENLSAKEEERVWVKRQTDGELDDGRLADGLTGEATVYKRRGMEKPEMGRPQIKPKRIRFLFDVSGSMYRFQYDGRLQRSLEAAVMLMETFERLPHKEKYVWDMYAHSGDSPTIPLIEAGQSLTPADRYKVVKKMSMISQYAFSGDYTVEAIEKAVTHVAQHDADDWFVIALSDANFSRYDITLQDLKRAMDKDPKVNTSLICIGDGAESDWIPKNFKGRGYRVQKTQDIPAVLRSIMSSVAN